MNEYCQEKILYIVFFVTVATMDCIFIHKIDVNRFLRITGLPDLKKNSIYNNSPIAYLEGQSI